MYYVIDKIANLDNGGLYARVRLWADKDAHDRLEEAVVESFAFPQLQSTGMRTIKDERGWLQRESDGVFVDPETIDPNQEPEWRRETYEVDIPGILIAAIQAYWERRAATGHIWPMNHADPRIGITTDDPRNLRQPAVMELEGEEREGVP